MVRGVGTVPQHRHEVSHAGVPSDNGLVDMRQPDGRIPRPHHQTLYPLVAYDLRMTGEVEALLKAQPEHGQTPPTVVTKLTERQALEHRGVIAEAPEGDADPTKDQVLRDSPILDDAKEDPGDQILWQQHQQEHRGTAISHRLALLRLILLRDEEALLPSISLFV